MRRIEERGEVTFGQAIKDYIQGWVSYGGRSTRAGYWWAQLAVVLYFVIGSLLSLALVTTVHVLGIIILCIFGLSGIFLGIASTGLTFRRYRDVGFKTVPIIIWEICAFIPGLNGIIGIASFVFTLLPTDQFVAEKENWLVRGKDTVDETQTTAASQPQLTKAAPAATTASTSLPTVVFYPDGREQEIK